MVPTTAGAMMCKYESDRFNFEKFVYTPFEINFKPDSVIEFAKNNYNFIMVDVIDGRTWQVQWNVDEENRMISRFY